MSEQSVEAYIDEHGAAGQLQRALAEAERLRALLVEALDGWEHSVTHLTDGYRDRTRIRKEAAR